MDNEQEVVKFNPVLYKFTNQEHSAELDNILAMFYQGVIANSVGIMQAYNLESQEEELILVGVELDENKKPNCFPLAKIFKAEDVSRYLAPNGLGGYYDPLNPAENEEAKENMRTFDDAVVESASE